MRYHMCAQSHPLLFTQAGRMGAGGKPDLGHISFSHSWSQNIPWAREGGDDELVHCVGDQIGLDAQSWTMPFLPAPSRGWFLHL